MAQLSEDFSADPEEAFSRIDENQDHRIDRAEFEQEISQIRGLLGTRKLAAALGQVQQDLQIRQSFAEETATQEQAPEIETLHARTQVLEQMVGYFSTLREDYSQKLDDLKQQQAALQAREDMGKAKAPPRARVFGGRNKKEPSPKMNLTASLGASARLEIKRQYTHQDDFDGPDSRKEPDTGQAGTADAEFQEEPDDEQGDDEDAENEDPYDEASNEEDEENEDEMDDEDEDAEDDEAEEEDDEVDEEQADEEDEATQLVAAINASEAPVKTDLETTLPPGSLPDVDEAEPQHVEGPEAEGTSEGAQEPSSCELTSQEPPVSAKADTVDPLPKTDASETVATSAGTATAASSTGQQTAPSKKAAKALKKKQKAKPKKEAAAKAPKKMPTAPSRVDSQRPSVTSVPTAEPASTKSQSMPPKSAKKGVDEEGFRCVQTLEMGLAVRNAICIGMEVWTVDWAGNVTVRERDDATKVRSEIPTNRSLSLIALI